MPVTGTVCAECNCERSRSAKFGLRPVVPELRPLASQEEHLYCESKRQEDRLACASVYPSPVRFLIHNFFKHDLVSSGTCSVWYRLSLDMYSEQELRCLEAGTEELYSCVLLVLMQKSSLT